MLVPRTATTSTTLRENNPPLSSRYLPDRLRQDGVRFSTPLMFLLVGTLNGNIFGLQQTT